MTQTETIQPKPRPDGVPEIQKVDWLLPVLNLDTVSQAYGLIRRKQIPDDCILRLGSAIRINADAVRAWLNGKQLK